MPTKHDKIEDIKRLLDGYRPFEAGSWAVLRAKLLLEWTYHSNAIEGNTLSFRETSLYLQRGLTAKGKPLEEHLALSNHQEAISFLETTVQEGFELSESLVRDIHKILFQNIGFTQVGEQKIPIEAGAYKKTNNHVLKADGSIHFYVEATAVPAEVAAFIKATKEKASLLHPIELAAYVHYELVRIHPFTDGNGRVARLLMNLFLMQAGYIPVVIKLENRDEYYRSLEEADRGKLRTFTNLIAREAENSLKLSLSVIRGELKEKHYLRRLRKERGLSQAELAKRTGIAQARISRIENYREPLTQKTLERLAAGLGVEGEELEG